MKVKVLHVISGLDPRGGGTTTALVGMARAQRDAGLDVRVFSTHGRDFERTAVDDLPRHGIDVALLGPVRTPLGLHPQLDAQLRPAIEAAEVVHIHGLWEQAQHRAARLAQAMDKPYLISPHGMLDPWSLAQHRFRKKIYLAWRLRRNLDRAAALHFTTQNEMKLTNPLGIKAPAFVEPLGVNLDEFDQPPATGSFRRMYPAIDDQPLILFLGRVHPGKGLEYLIPALRDVQPDNTRLAVVGPDSEQHTQAMRELADSHSVTERIIFTGMLSGKDRLAALADADLFCLPSDHENFGLAVIEALACGTPVIVSDQVSLCADIAEHDVGEVVRPAVQPLATALSRWLSDSTCRADAARRARPFVESNYDWRRIGERWVNHYRRAVDSEPALLSSDR